jgi:hypothetical protein
MNQLPGIRTVSSCAGHSSPTAEAGVVFVADSQESVAQLLIALRQLLGWRGGFAGNHAQWHALWVQADLHDDGTVVYRLKIDGYPIWAQRGLLEKVEAELKCATSLRRPETLPPSTRHAFDCNVDKKPCC